MTSKNALLSNAEQEYLKDGTVSGSYRPHELENQIEEKRVPELPGLLEALFRDVELLAEGYFESDPPEKQEEVEAGEPVSGERYQPLNTDEGYRAWLELMGFDDQPTKQTIVDAFSYSGGIHGSAPAKFGAKLGEMTSQLMRWPDFGGIENEDVVTDLVWGFLVGLHFHRRRASDVTEEVVREDTADILQRLEQRAEAYADFMSKPSGLVKAASELKKKEKIRKEMAQQVSDILGENPSIETRKMQPELVERFDSEGLWEKFCFDVVNHLADSHTTGEHPLRSVSQWDAFWDEHGPVEDFDVEAFVTADRVASIIVERQLVERRQLRTTIETDAEALADKTWRGAPAVDVLPAIVDEGPISSRDVAERALGSSDYEGSVTRLAKDLAGQDCDSRSEEVSVWVDRPILRGDPGGWNSTAYGKAVNHMLRIIEAREKRYLQPIEGEPFPEELLIDALEEVDAKGTGPYPP